MNTDEFVTERQVSASFWSLSSAFAECADDAAAETAVPYADSIRCCRRESHRSQLPARFIATLQFYDQIARPSIRRIRLLATISKISRRHVVHEVKRRVIDSFGCALGAWNEEPCVIARKVASEFSAKHGATIIGTKHQAPPDWAAFATGCCIRYFDYNDTYLSKEPAHPSDNISAAARGG